VKRIAHFVSSTKYEDLPEEASRIAGQAILDWVGVAVGGAREPAVRMLVEYADDHRAREESVMIGGGGRTSAEMAAWVNGTAGHVLDYDDTSPSAAGYNLHPTAPIVPAILALAEPQGASGKALLTAYTVGIEIECKVGAVIGRHNSEIGWHPTPVLGTIGATAACANLLGLEPGKVEMALGIAASLAGGLTRNFGSMTKSLHCGNAARNGVVAARLAQKGYTANENILEGKFGFSEIFSGGKVQGVGPIEDLGDPLQVISPGISFKAYPCCRSTHSSIDAALYLRDIQGIDADKVAAITCKTSPRHTELARFHKPERAYEGKFSIPYCIAVALLRGRILLEDFTDEKVTDPRAQALLALVDYEYPPELSQGPMSLRQEVVIRLQDGKEVAHTVDVPKGDPVNPMTEEEMADKFRDCASSWLQERKVENLLKMLMELDSLEHCMGLFEILAQSAKGRRG